MSSVVVIPARGGSKRIPGKNIRPFRGKPMIAYAIETALATSGVDEVLVSTDSEEIAEIARRFGASVPFVRPAHLADDFCGTTDVIRHAQAWLAENASVYDHLCCLYPTSPLLKVSDFASGLETLKSDPTLQYAFSVGEFAYPVYRALKAGSSGGVAMLFPEHAGSRSQDLPETFHDAGQFYWGRWEAWEQGLPLFDQHTRAITLPRHRVVDIDTEEDWHIAELYAQLLEAREGGSA